MAVVIASALDKDVAGTPLFRGVSFKLERGDRMTLAGRNGAGKTTLLRMIFGETGVDGGELVFEKGTRVALHDQRPPRALGPLHGLGFSDEQLDRRLSSFSGGELTRASLARALAGDPDLLLLDEPTNHLDIASLECLESYLQNVDAAVVLVAHDRWFLEAVGTAVLELEAGRSRFFAGTWHAWRAEKAQRELALGRAIERQQAEIAKLERFVNRFKAGTRAKQ